MNNQLPDPQAPDPQEQRLALRSSTSLASVPAERPPAPVAVPAPAPAQATPAPMTANAQTDHAAFPQPRQDQLPVSTLAAGGVALLAALGWVMERRRRRLLETDKDSVMWADVQPAGGSGITTAGGLDDILPDSPDPDEAARAIYVTAIGETNSRREATLIDLHQLEGKLARRREKGDTVAAVLLLQQHLVDFRYTSPWAFLELLELYKLLDRHKEWEIAREAFRARFGQNAPAWSASSTAGAQLADDQQLCGNLERMWPFRQARMFILRWMLGENDMRRRRMGPPQLPLGVYRDLMDLDNLLDEVMMTRPAAARDSLL